MIEVSTDAFRFAEVFTISRGSRTQANVVTVRVTRNGVTGWGECVPYARYGETVESVSEQIAALPADISRADLQDAMASGAARNAVDCALWDLEAKTAGKRVWQLLGLAQPGPEITAFTLSLAEPEVLETKARENAHRPLLKIKLGTPDDMPRLEAVRRGAPGSRIVVDANEGWSAEVYSDLAPHLLRLGVAMVEQPLPAGDDGSLIGIERPIPVCADESAHDRATMGDLKGKYDMINIKLDKTGGLTEALALKQAAIAEGYGIMTGCMMGSSLAMAPATLVAQGCAITDLDAPLLLAEDRPHPLFYDEAGVHPPEADLWG